MHSFHPVVLEDRTWMEPILRQAGRQGSEYTFSNAYCWQQAFQIEAAQSGPCCLIRNGRRGEHWYLAPAGPEEGFLPAVEELLHTAQACGEPLRLTGLLRSDLDRLGLVYPGRLTAEEVRDSWDYLYSAESLATLAGKKLHSKRNFINRFTQEHPDWSFQTIQAENIVRCQEMHRRWQSLAGENDSLREEGEAVDRALAAFEELGLLGGMLFTAEELVAFTFGSPVTEDTFVVHVEKAFSEVAGAYPMVNREFVRQLPDQFTVINREDDLGELGLRKAKESYRPIAMVEKYTAIFSN